MMMRMWIRNEDHVVAVAVADADADADDDADDDDDDDGDEWPWLYNHYDYSLNFGSCTLQIITTWTSEIQLCLLANSSMSMFTSHNILIYLRYTHLSPLE